MFNWMKKIRRKRVFKTEFPSSWRNFLNDHVAHYHYLSTEEQEKLEKLIQFFIAEKNFEGCGGLEMTDEIKVVISAQACLLVLGLPPFQYAELDSVLVYPSTVKIPAQKSGFFDSTPGIVPGGQPILGQAWLRGPVILVWDAVVRGARHPERGHNVVYHEFAHILDMRDGSADGTPVLHSRADYNQWVEICSREFLRLKKQREKGKKSILDQYGAVHEAEFFAVATELFFDR
ncbi:MAG: zinc-dependent peptidase, partial [Desulfobulbaceae bacterium]